MYWVKGGNVLNLFSEQQEGGKSQIFSGWWAGTEDNIASWDEEQQVQQVVAKLGRTIQDCQGNLQEFLYGENDARRASSKGS